MRNFHSSTNCRRFFYSLMNSISWRLHSSWINPDGTYICIYCSIGSYDPIELHEDQPIYYHLWWNRDTGLGHSRYCRKNRRPTLREWCWAEDSDPGWFDPVCNEVLPAAGFRHRPESIKRNSKLEQIKEFRSTDTQFNGRLFQLKWHFQTQPDL